MIVDNTELHDVDIFDITDPREPAARSPTFDLVELAAEQARRRSTTAPTATPIFLHDMVVKKIDDAADRCWLNYWDAGYIKLNVTNPANPRDHRRLGLRRTVDPLTGERTPPEGNGHQAEFSHDNKYVLAADEDFDAYRLAPDHTGRTPARPPSSPRGLAAPPPTVPGRADHPAVRLRGFVGEACTAAGPLPTPATRRASAAAIARGTCAFQEKDDNAAAAGYDAGVIFNSNSAGQRLRDAADHARRLGRRHPVRSSSRAAWPADPRRPTGPYTCAPGEQPGHTPTPAPQDGAESSSWRCSTAGATRTCTRRTGAGRHDHMRRVDSFAIEEALDERFAVGFGDLSVHEFATDPNANLAYSLLLRGRHARVQLRAGRPDGAAASSSTRAATTSGASSVHDRLG